MAIGGLDADEDAEKVSSWQDIKEFWIQEVKNNLLSLLRKR